MGIFDFLTDKGLEKRVKRLEEDVGTLKAMNMNEYTSFAKNRGQILAVLKEPMTTQEVATRMGLSRSRTSVILNQLEREGKLKEVGKRGREDLYARV